MGTKNAQRRPAGRLDVHLHGVLAGTLERDAGARLRFAYGEDWVAAARAPLSLSLPVRAEPYEHEECAPYFVGLLPEGGARKALARALGIPARDPFGLLAALAGECAGAVSLAPAAGPGADGDRGPPRWLGEAELGALLAGVPGRPFAVALGEAEGAPCLRLTLAGAQNKVGVVTEGERIGIGHGEPPTTDVLKAPIPRERGSIANEALCMGLAALIGLDVAAASARTADSREYLLVRRYDRDPRSPDRRLHQEDLCQALGLLPNVKYEKEGGPTVADCAALIRRHGAEPARDLARFLDALLFNLAIGNHDGHTKNFSLLLDGPDGVRMSPRYDLISTVVYLETDRRLAMRYGGEYEPLRLRGANLDRLAVDLSLDPGLVRRRTGEMSEAIDASLDPARNSAPPHFQDHPILDDVTAVIAERTATMARSAAEPPEPACPAASPIARRRHW